MESLSEKLPSKKTLAIGGFAIVMLLIIFLIFYYASSNPTTAEVISKNGLTTSNSISTGGVLKIGDANALKNGAATLVMQGDGNLVLYNGVSPNWKPVQATMTSGTGYVAVINNMGVVQVLNGSSPVWTGATPAGSVAGTWFLKVNDNSTLSVVSPAGVATAYTLKVL